MDCAGSFLGINKDNQHSAFIVSHEDNIENYYQIAMNSQADKHITEPLKNRSSLTYLWHATDYEHSPQQWQQFMYKANLISEANCYYATTNNKNLLNHDKLIFWRTIEEQL